MTYRKEFREIEREAYWSFPRIVVGLIVAMVALGSVGFVFKVLSTPSRVISKTLDTDNVINNYEWFHDVNGNVLARLAQIKTQKGYLERETDSIERNRLRIELSAMQQNCRENTRRYNANAEKINRGLFRGYSLPERLDAGACE